MSISNTLTDKKVLIGITAGIAAYKVPDIIRRLKEQGAEVRVVMTEAATQFITPLTLQAVSQNPVHTQLLDESAEAAMGHIELAKWAEAIVIAPATADCLAKLAHGHANDLLSTLCLASQAPVFIAPAMNQQMWHHPATQANLQLLTKWGVTQIGPDAGEQACGDIGYGRLVTTEKIIAQLVDTFSQSHALAGKHVVITAGPTQEAIDPVRFIANRSSGKMGYALANAVIASGASVTLISGPTALTAHPKAVFIPVVTTEEMYQQAMEQSKKADIFIAAAAPADYRLETIATQKIKKASTDCLTLNLVKNSDILASVAALTTQRPFVVGFAAETQDLKKYALAKLACKNLDMMMANQVGHVLEQASGSVTSGFESDENAITAFWPGGEKQFPLTAKQLLATELLTLIIEQYHAKNSSKNPE